jgi:hypothetical protein
MHSSEGGEGKPFPTPINGRLLNSGRGMGIRLSTRALRTLGSSSRLFLLPTPWMERSRGLPIAGGKTPKIHILPS